MTKDTVDSIGQEGKKARTSSKRKQFEKTFDKWMREQRRQQEHCVTSSVGKGTFDVRKKKAVRTFSWKTTFSKKREVSKKIEKKTCVLSYLFMPFADNVERMRVRMSSFP